MSIRNNFKYSLILTLSTYLVPLLVFPYISRVLGAERIGAIDTVDGIIDYLVLFSMMGMQALGIREIARHKADKADIKKLKAMVIKSKLSTNEPSIDFQFDVSLSFLRSSIYPSS